MPSVAMISQPHALPAAQDDHVWPSWKSSITGIVTDDLKYQTKLGQRGQDFRIPLVHLPIQWSLYAFALLVAMASGLDTRKVDYIHA